MPRDLLAPRQSAPTGRRAPRDLLAGPSATASASFQRFDESGVPIGGSLPPEPVATPSPPDRFGGAAMNATAGLNDVIYGTAGALPDLGRGIRNLAAQGINAVAGTDIQPLPENAGFGSRGIGEMMGAIRPELDPANTIAASPQERIARGVGQGVASTVIPAGVVGGVQRAGVQVSPLVQAVAGRSNSGTAMAADAMAGATAGAGSAAAMEASPDSLAPIAGMAGGLAGGAVGTLATGLPALAREGGRLAGRAVEPFTEAGRQRMAGRSLREGVTDPQAILDIDTAAAPLVPGSVPTTGQASGDMGALAMERASQTRFPEAFNQRRADQNSARRAALDGIQPGGAPEKVAQSVRAFAQAIDDETQAAFGAARSAARTSAERAGVPMRPDEAGAAMRGALETARATAKERERALWSAVDPDGTLALQPANVRRQAAETIRTMPASAKPPSGEEAAILDVLGRYGDVVPFGEVTALSSRLKAEMRAERMANGETPAYARMARLNGALQQDLDGAVTGRARFEAREVAEGRMAPENTMEAKVQSWTNAWREARGEDQASAGAVASGGTRSVPSGYGSGLPPQGRPGGAPGNPRLSRDDLDPGSFDRAAQERLTAANTATRERAQTFDNGTLAPIRARPATNAPYDMPAAAVPARIFFGRPQSGEAIGRYRQAVGPEQAIATVEPYAVDQARRAALNEDGTFDPVKLDRWRRQHQDALRAFPELDARLADAGRAAQTMGEVAVTRRARLEETQKGALGRVVGIESPDEMVRAVGSLFGRQDGARQLGHIRRAIGDDKEALEGLRKSVAEFMSGRLIGNTEVGTSGQTGIRSDQYQTFVRQNAALLRVVFTPNELRAMDAVAADLQRANRSLVATRIPGQSNTAQDTLAVQGSDNPMTVLAKLIGTSAAAGGGVGVATGSLSGIAVGAGTMFAGAMREAGIRRVDELVRDALLDPRKAQVLLQTVRPGDRAGEMDLARRFRRTVLASGAMALDEARGEDAPAIPRGPMALPALPPALQSSGNALVDTLVARQRAMPPWMQDGTQGSDLQRALAARRAP